MPGILRWIGIVCLGFASGSSGIAQELPALPPVIGGANPPEQLPNIEPGTPLPVPERTNALEDPQVIPAQQLQTPVIPGNVPDRPGGITATPPYTGTAVLQVPAPTVVMQIRAPSAIAPGKSVPYQLVLQNTSRATAYKVVLRMPWPEGAANLSKIEPFADNLDRANALKAPVKELRWEFRSLAAGEQKKIELEFLPAAMGKDIRARAFVSYEHGQEVITNIEKPKLMVKKTAPAQSAKGEPFYVRVDVRNEGSVPINQVRLIEEISSWGEFKTDTTAEKTSKANQRVWQLGALARGQTKTVTYQVTSKQGGEITTTSNAASEDNGIVAETAESKTSILVPELAFALTGPETVPSKSQATYEATVRNNGTLTLQDVSVSIPIPPGCDPSKVTTGARRFQDRMTWYIPKLPPGEAQAFRLSVTANSSGKRTIKATARDGLNTVEQTKEVATNFLGRADLHWAPDVNPVLLNIGKRSQMTIRVSNDGEETEAGLVARVKIPAGLKVVQVTPNTFTTTQDNELLFKAMSLSPGKTEIYTITVEAETAGQKRIGMRLDAQSLGEASLLKEQTIEVTGSR